MVKLQKEYYDKESIAKEYPVLFNLLFRKAISVDDFSGLNNLLSVLITMIENGDINNVNMTSQELKFKSLA